MKNIAIFSFILILISFGCRKADEDSVKDDATLSITNSQWYLSRDIYGDGFVNLRISGSTNGDKIKILTSGDGALYWFPVDLDPEKNFNTDMGIAFFHEVPAVEFEMSSKVMAIKGNDSITVSLKSGKLKF